MTRKISIKFLLTTAFCLLMGIGHAFAQAGTGTITGIVADSTGAVVPNATVKLVNVNTGLENTGTASGDGIYTFTLLQPGKYTVSATSGSFAEQKLNVEVQVGRTTDANFTLGAGDVSATVEVTAEGIQTTSSNSDAVLNETAIANLPINGRRFQDFATLTPTAQIDTERNQISLSGQRGINANINVDGLDYNQPFFGGIRGGERSNFAPTIPQESIKEFQVVAAGYSAEFGRSSGGIVNVVTKGGTNDFRGSAFYLIRPDKLSRNHKLVKAIEAERGLDITAAPTQQQFGGSFGGPIIENKLFFFGSYEQQRFRADRLVLFSLGTIARSPANQETFDFLRSQETGYQLTNDAKTLLGRIDWNVNNSTLVNFRYSFNDSIGLNSVAVGDAGVLFNPVVDSALSNEGTEKDRNHVFVSQMTNTFGTSYANDFRFQYARGDRPRFANAQTPLVTISQVGLFGTRSFLPTTQFDTRVQFVEAFSVLKGNHNAKFGGEFSDILNDQAFGFNQFGAYSTNTSRDAALQIASVTPGSTTDRRFDTGSFYTQQIGNTAAAFKVKELAFYAQDTWRIRPTFTINYGLRVEKQYNPEAEVGNDTIINLVKNASFPLLGGRGFDPTVIPDSDWQFGPRLGFAWDIEGNGKSVFRGFSGVYYARTPGIILAAPVNNFRIPPGDVTVQLPFTAPASILTQTGLATFIAANPAYLAILNATGATNCTGPTPNVAACAPTTVFRQFALLGINLNSSPIGNLPSLSAQQIQQISGIIGTGITPGIGANLIAMQEGYDNPQSFQIGFGYEREVMKDVVLGIDYSHVNTIHLQRNRDINLPVPTPNAISGRPTFNRANRPIPTLGRLLLRESSGRSLFRAVTFKARIVKSWANINAYYTYSRSTSDDDNERNATGIFYENSYDLTREYGLARLDRPHQFVANPVFFLPYGFEVSSAIRLRSGTPIDATVGSDVNGDGINNDRPLLAVGVPFERNFFRNQEEFTVDLRVQKGFSFGENRRLIFSTEFFNLFNNANIQVGGTQTIYCGTTPAIPFNDRTTSCGLNGPTNPTFLRLRNDNGDLITPTGGNFSRTPVFQVQLGARFQF